MNATELRALIQDIDRFGTEHAGLKYEAGGNDRTTRFRAEVLAALEQAEWIERDARIERTLDATN